MNSQYTECLTIEFHQAVKLKQWNIPFDLKRGIDSIFTYDNIQKLQ